MKAFVVGLIFYICLGLIWMLLRLIPHILDIMLTLACLLLGVYSVYLVGKLIIEALGI